MGRTKNVPGIYVIWSSTASDCFVLLRRYENTINYKLFYVTS